MGKLSQIFYHIGKGVSHHPYLTFLGGILLTVACGFGFVNLRVTDDPQELWVPQTSRANIEQEYFLQHFGAFFRINTIYLTPLEEDKETQDIFKTEYIELLYHLQEAIEGARVPFEGSDYMLDDFCYKPITGEGCLITSPTEFWKMDLDEIKKDDNPKQTA